MYRAVLPKPSEFEHWLLIGDADGSVEDSGRAQALVEDELLDTTDADAAQDTDGPRVGTAPPPGQ
jgi:hypothetical protein